MGKKTTSIRVDAELWKSVKKICIDDEQDISDYIDGLVRKDIMKRKKLMKKQ